MSPLKIDTWKKSQTIEAEYWKELETQGVIIEKWTDIRYKKVASLSQKTIGNSSVIVDVGSGPYGIIHHYIKKGRLKVSLDPLTINNPKKEDSIKSIAECLPLKQNAVDTLFCVNALDHCHNPTKSLAEMKRTLKHNGTLVLMVHIIEFKKKLLHSILSKTKIRKIFHAKKIRYGLSQFEEAVLGGFDVLEDSKAHPFYFLPKDVIQLLKNAGFNIRIMEIKLSKMYKNELFIVAKPYEQP